MSGLNYHDERPNSPHSPAKPGTTEERPFGPGTRVYKVMGKMFVLTGDEPEPQSVNLKCDPDDALFFRHRFEGITTGYQ